MKFQEIDRLAQSVDKLPDIANLGDRYVYHCLREIYDRYLAGKLGKEETEVERRKLYQAHRLYREQEAAHLKPISRSRRRSARPGHSGRRSSRVWEFSRRSSCWGSAAGASAP